MSIAGDLIRGHTDAIILARLLRGDSYGYEINKVISTLSNNRFELKEATLYTAFKRLEELGYRAVQAQPVDLFPRTAHVETVLRMERRNR